MPPPIVRALVSGTVASLATTAAVTLLSSAGAHSSAAPIKATGRWVSGDRAASGPIAETQQTVVGYATHHAASFFWAYLFERLAGMRGRPGAPVLLRHAAAVTAVAAVVDHGVIPKRLTPGWHRVLPKRYVATTYAVLAIGLAVGGLLSDRRRR